MADSHINRNARRQSRPLISPTVIDVAQQRLYLISIFVLIQAWKLYDWIRLKQGLFTGAEVMFAFKYLLLDGIYLWILPVFRVSWLTFTPLVSILQILCMALSTIFLTTATSFPFSSLLMSLWAISSDDISIELSLTGTKVKPREILNSNAHLKGKHRIQILPESTAYLNPEGISHCVESKNHPINIPIRFNSSDPSFIQLYRYDFHTNERFTVNFSKKEITKLVKQKYHISPNKPRIIDLELSVSNPGLYRLAKVKDASNLDVRLYRSDVMVPNCPNAYILSSESEHRCVGEVDRPKIYVTGVPPLRLRYRKKINDKVNPFAVQSLQPDGFNSPLQAGNTPGFFWDGKNKLNWAISETVDVSLDTSLSAKGDYWYRIDEVEDALGNLINFTSTYDDYENFRELEARKLIHFFSVHERPKLKFSDCSMEYPRKLSRGSSTDISIHLAGDESDGSYNVEFEFVEEGENDELLDAVIFNHTFTKSRQLSVKKPGTYTIRGVSGSHCLGDILEPSTCLVLVPPEPNVVAQFDKIEDKCVGSIGLKAAFTFTGTPPFTIFYTITQDGVVIENKNKKITNTRYQFEFKPNAAATYVYHFKSLSDAIYNGIKLDEKVFKVEQIARVMASASFNTRHSRMRSCSGDSVLLPVKLNGVPPFKLNYEIAQGTSKRSPYVINDINTYDVEISTPKLTFGGSYTVSLVSVEDGNGCVSTLNVNDVIVDVPRQRPKVRFLPIDDMLSIQSLEGATVPLPLQVSGKPPYDITYYEVEPISGKKIGGDRHITIKRANGEFLRVSNAGTYVLSSVRDQFCPGEVSNEGREFNISWLERPSLSLVDSPKLKKLDDKTYEMIKVCQDGEDSVDLTLTGSPPFKIYYSVTPLANSALRKKDTSMQVATRYASIKLETSDPGQFKYTFHGISDARYESKNKNENNKITVIQNVRQLPSAEFTRKGKFYKTCVPDKNVIRNDYEAIPIQLTGQPPFTLSLSVSHESNGKTDRLYFENIDTNNFILNENIYDQLTLGKHTVTIEEVTDGNGCAQDKLASINSKYREYGSSSNPNSVLISVSDIPKIRKRDVGRNHYCVGDIVKFDMTGVSPFNVTYEFNNARQLAKADTFSRFASSTGDLKVISLSDSASDCLVNYTANADDLSLTVHPIPSVEITQGLTNIHEGDRAELVFTFSGTPPFTLTYIRTDEVDDSDHTNHALKKRDTRRKSGRYTKTEIVEPHTVTEIYDYEYRIMTNLQGTYEAIQVEDRYCIAKKERIN